MRLEKILKVDKKVGNKGEQLEYAILKHYGFKGKYTRNNISYKKGYDLECLKSNIKLANRSTLCNCNNTDTLEEAIDRYLLEDISKNYMIGFELLEESFYYILHMNKEEYKILLMEYGKFDIESRNKAKGSLQSRTLRLMVRTLSHQRKILWNLKEWKEVE